MMPTQLDGIVTKNELNLIMLVDTSYSMSNGKIQQVNNAIPSLKSKLSDLANDECVDLKLRVISFSNDPKWEIGSIESGTDINDVVWSDLEVDNMTSTAKAIREANKSLKKTYLGAHALHPVVILITDGYCTEDHKDYLAAIDEMRKRLSGSTGKEKVTRIAIGVGDQYNREELEEFASEGFISDVKQPLVFDVDKVDDLGKVINWAAVSSMYSSISDKEGDEDIVDLGDPDWDD